MDTWQSSKNCLGLQLKTEAGAGEARRLGLFFHSWGEGVLVLPKWVWTRDTRPQIRACLPIPIIYGNITPLFLFRCLLAGTLQVMLWRVSSHLTDTSAPTPWEPSGGSLLLSLPPLPELLRGLAVHADTAVKYMCVVSTQHSKENITFALEELTVEGRREIHKGYKAVHYELHWGQAVRWCWNPVLGVELRK